MHVRILIHLHFIMAKQVDENVCREQHRRFCSWLSGCAECVHAAKMNEWRTYEVPLHCLCLFFFRFHLRTVDNQTEQKEYFNTSFMLCICVYAPSVPCSMCHIDTETAIKSRKRKENKKKLK